MRNLMFPRRVVTPRQGLQGCTVYKSCWGKCVKVSRTAQKGDATTSEWIEFHVRVCCFFPLSSSSSSSTSCSSSSSLGALCYPSLKVLTSSWTWAQGLSSEQSLRTSLICMWPQCKFDRKWEIKRWNTLRDELAVSRKSQFDLDCAAIQSENRVAACEEVTLPQFEAALHKNVKRQCRYSTSRRTM